jgi:hypothetical protein
MEKHPSKWRKKRLCNDYTHGIQICEQVTRKLSKNKTHLGAAIIFSTLVREMICSSIPLVPGNANMVNK